MASLVLGTIGAVAAPFFGLPPTVGWAIGSGLGSLIGGSKTQRVQQQMLQDLRVTGTEYGQPIPFVEAHPRIAGQIWWASAIRPIAHTQTQEQGKGTSQSVETTTYTYEVDLLIGLTDREIAGITRIWWNGELVYNFLTPEESAELAGVTPDAGWLAQMFQTLQTSLASDRWRRIAVYTGAADQLPDPTYEAAVGVANAVAYRGRGSVFFEGLNLGGSGQIPNLTFEVNTKGFNEGELSYSLFYEFAEEGTDNDRWSSGLTINRALASTENGRYLWVALGPESTNAFYSVATSIGLIDNLTREWVFKSAFRNDKPSSIISGFGKTWQDRAWVPWDNGSGLTAAGACDIYETDGTIINTGIPPAFLNSDGILGCNALVEITPADIDGNPFIPGVDYDPGSSQPILFTRFRLGFGDCLFYGLINTAGAGAGLPWSTQQLGTDQVGLAGFSSRIFMNGNRIGGRAYFSTTGSNNNFIGYAKLVGMGATVTIVNIRSSPAGNVASCVGADGYLYVQDGAIGRNTWILKLDRDGNFVDEVNLGFSAAAIHDDLFGNLYVQYASGGTNRVARIIKSTMEIDATAALESTSMHVFGPSAFYGSGMFAATATGGVAQQDDIYLLSPPGQLHDETIRDVVERRCLYAGLNSDQFDVSRLSEITKPVRGFVISQVTSTRTILEILASAYFFEVVVSDKVYFVPRGSAATVTVPYADTGAFAGDGRDVQRVALKLNSEIELPAKVAITYPNLNIDYQHDTEYSDRLITAVENSVQEVQMPLAMFPSEAKAIADTMLLDQAVAMLETKLTLLGDYVRLEPTDPINVVLKDGTTVRLRLVRRRDSYPLLEFEAVLDDPSVLSTHGITTSVFQGSVSVQPPIDTLLYVLDIALLRDADDHSGVYVAVRGVDEPYPGGLVYISADDVQFVQVASITESAVAGVCNSVLGDWNGNHRFDEGNFVIVDVGYGTIASVTRTSVLNDGAVNSFLIGSEIVQARNATLISPGVYKLSGLLRGRRGTEWAMTGHVAGERCVQLRTSGLRRVNLENSEIGLERFYRGVTMGRRLSTATSQSVTSQGVCLKPFSPVDLRARRDASNNIIFSLQRRTRLGTRLIGPLGVSCPLGEDSLSIEIDIETLDSPPTVVRTISSSSLTGISYTAAEQTADGLTPGDPVMAIAYQISATVGRGYPLRRVV